jgi:hypothetical protein
VEGGTGGYSIFCYLSMFRDCLTDFFCILIKLIFFHTNFCGPPKISATYFLLYVFDVQRIYVTCVIGLRKDIQKNGSRDPKPKQIVLVTKGSILTTSEFLCNFPTPIHCTLATFQFCLNFTSETLCAN